jgi:hypothetical protein
VGVFGGADVIGEGAAHVVDFFNEVWVQPELTAVVMHAMNALVVGLTGSHAREHVHVVPFALESGRQLSDVGCDPAHRNGM